MTKSSWGTKRTCVSCSASFYDLNKNPATCPKCDHTFDTTAVVKAKRKSSKRGASETDIVVQQTILAPRKPVKKVKKDDDDSEGGLNDLIELDDGDDIESLHELSELEEMEDNAVNEDDADEEALIEDLDPGKNALVGSVEEEEALEHIGDIEDEDEEEEVPVKKKPKKK